VSKGWIDESMLSVEGWKELDIADVQTSVTWWHDEGRLLQHPRAVDLQSRDAVQAEPADLAPWL
jgi:hypothetical protein